MQFVLFTNAFKQIIIHGRQFKFTEVKVITLGVEHYDYNTSCVNNNVRHNNSDVGLPSKVLKIKGVILIALFFDLFFFSNIYYDF